MSGRRRVVLRVESGGPHREDEESKPMMPGPEKSDLAIVAVKPANKVALQCETVRREVSRSGVGGAKGVGQGECGLAKHALDSAPGSRVTGAGTHAASNCRLDPR